MVSTNGTPNNTPLQFFQALSMLLSDRPVRPVDAIFFHARSFDGDADGLFELIEELLPNIDDKCVAINGSDGESFYSGKKAWPGKTEYMHKLKPLGCNIITTRPALHTLEEAQVFLELAEERGWKRAIVIAQPFQLLRIMLSHIKTMDKSGYHMNIYSATPTSVNWIKSTCGSQGQPDIVRFNQIESEFSRLAPYQAQDNLATISELIEYLFRKRDIS